MASKVDLTMEALGVLGYTGSIQDRLIAYYRDNYFTLGNKFVLSSADLQQEINYPQITDMREVEDL